MARFAVYAVITGSKYLGEVDAETEEAAIAAGQELETCYVSVCHQCARQIDDPSITEITAEEISEVKP